MTRQPCICSRLNFLLVITFGLLGKLQDCRVSDQISRWVRRVLTDHLPLYRQETIFARAGMALPRSTLAQWVGVCGVQLQPLVDALKSEMLKHVVLHADETPVAMLKPGTKKTHRAYLWAYAPGAFEDLKAVVYDFCESRAGEHARAFLGEWRGSLVCDDYAGYKAGFVSGITEVGCMAHSRRKFFDLHVSSKSQIAGQACAYISQLYDVEREVKHLSADERLQIRQRESKPPGTGKTHRSYLWAYAAGAFEDTRAVVYDFCESRAGENA